MATALERYWSCSGAKNSVYCGSLQHAVTRTVLPQLIIIQLNVSTQRPPHNQPSQRYIACNVPHVFSLSLSLSLCVCLSFSIYLCQQAKMDALLTNLTCFERAIYSTHIAPRVCNMCA